MATVENPVAPEVVATKPKKPKLKPKPKEAKKPEPTKTKSCGISVWATPKDQAMYQQVVKDSEESLSRIVRILVKNYVRTGKADGLPTLSTKD